MKRFFCSLLIVSIIAHCYAQDFTKNVEKAGAIKADDTYIYGEGEGTNKKNADSNAMYDLLSQIFNVQVSGGVSTTVTNEQDGQSVTSHVGFEQVMNTYINASLSGVQRIILSESPTFKVLRYVKKSDVEKIFESRKNLIQRYAIEACMALDENNVGDALRYFYWSNMLLRTLRPTDNVSVPLEYDKTEDASILISRSMREIFAHLKTEIVGVQENTYEYEVRVTYNGQPVGSIDMRYYDNSDWSEPVSITDGKGLIELSPDYSDDKVRIEYEYQYLADAKQDNTVREVIESLDEETYKVARVSIPLDKSIIPSNIKLTAQSVAATTTTGSVYLTDSVKALSDEDVVLYSSIIQNVVDAIRKQNDYASIESCFTEEGYNIFKKLIAYGKAKIIGSDFDLMFTELNGYVTCRSVPMQFSFSAGRKFVENVVFVFEDSLKLIDNIPFGLSEVAKDDIFDTKPWSMQAKEVLMSFLENYKTAYALGRVEYLESIFSDDALIIVGNVVEKLEGSPELGYTTRRYVEKTKQTKQEYITRLKRVFRSNEFVNIKFANNDVRKLGMANERYAIQIKQDYFSENYGDTGWLTLMVNVENPQKPIIYVRVWEEEYDPEFGPINPAYF